MSEKNTLGVNSLHTRLDEQMPWKISDVIFTYVFIFVLSLIIVGGLMYASFDVNVGIFTALLQIFISLVTLTIIYYFVVIKYEVPIKEAFGLYFDKIPYFLKSGAFAAAAIVMTTSSINYLFTTFNDTVEKNPYSFMPEDKLRAIIFLAIFIAPIVEELFFRGFMQPALVRTLGAFPGVFVTALIFGMSHTQYLEYNVALVSVTCIGLILGAAKYYTNSVIPGIFAHLLNNMLAVLSLLSVN